MSKSGIILIILGCVFLANNFGLIEWRWLRQWWPLLLIALGVWSILDPHPRGPRRRRDADNGPT